MCFLFLIYIKNITYISIKYCIFLLLSLFIVNHLDLNEKKIEFMKDKVDDMLKIDNWIFGWETIDKDE